jgi:uncharacterized repeat protein (TIGR01451 family)
MQRVDRALAIHFNHCGQGKGLLHLRWLITTLVLCFAMSPANAQFEVQIGPKTVIDNGNNDRNSKENVIFFLDTVDLVNGRRIAVSLVATQTNLDSKPRITLSPATITNVNELQIQNEVIQIRSKVFTARNVVKPKIDLEGWYYHTKAGKINNADILAEGAAFEVGAAAPRVYATIDPAAVAGLARESDGAKFKGEVVGALPNPVNRMQLRIQYTLGQDDQIILPNSAIAYGYSAEKIFIVNTPIDQEDGDISDGICDIGSNNPKSGNYPIKHLCPLRAALTESEMTDQSPEPNAIHFNIPGTGVPRIQITQNKSFSFGSLGALRPVIIDGTTQPGGLVIVDGSLAAAKDFAGNAIVGLDFVGKDMSVFGLNITGFPSHGIYIRPSGGPLIGNISVEGDSIINNHGDGIHISSIPNNMVSRSFIGGNVGKGIAIEGSSASGNQLSGNYISGNGDVGIRVSGGANNQQAAPVLTSATSTDNGVLIRGTLPHPAGKSFTLEFFANSLCDPSGSGEGEDFIGTAFLPADTGTSFTASLPVSLSAGQYITATATDESGNTSEFSRCIPLQALQPTADLELVKTANKASFTIGENAVFTLTLVNKGPNTATGVKVRDLLPAGMRVTSATPSVGSYDNITGIWAMTFLSDTGQATLTIVATTTQPGTLTNTAEVTASDQFDPDSSPANGVASEDDQSSVAINVQPLAMADLELTKTSNKTTMTIGDMITYTVTLSNIGPNTATGIRIVDLAPEGMSFGVVTTSIGFYDKITGIWSVASLGSGSQGTLTIQSTASAAGTITNKAEVVASDQRDPDSTPNNGVATEDDQSSVSIIVQPVGIADLELTITSNKTSVTVGETITYTVTLSNKGPNTATGIRITDLAPSGMSFGQVTTTVGIYDKITGIWSVASLGGGSQGTLTIQGTASAAGTITNKAEVVASDQRDPDSSPNNGVASEDDQGSVSVQVSNVASVEVQIIQLINQVRHLVEMNELRPLHGKVLTELLTISLELYHRGFTGATILSLKAFIVSVGELVRNQQLSAEEGRKLIDAAHNIIQQLLPITALRQNNDNNPQPLGNDKEDKPESTLLHPNFPNPFYASTVISFQLARESKTQVLVYDAKGRMIAQLLDKAMPAGHHTITWQPANLSAGLYVLRFQAGDYVKTQRMMMIK